MGYSSNASHHNMANIGVTPVKKSIKCKSDNTSQPSAFTLKLTISTNTYDRKAYAKKPSPCHEAYYVTSYYESSHIYVLHLYEISCHPLTCL